MEILKPVMALCEVGHTCFVGGQMRRRSVGYVFLSSRAPDAAQRFFSGALQSRGHVSAFYCVAFRVPVLRSNAGALQRARDTRAPKTGQKRPVQAP